MRRGVSHSRLPGHARVIASRSLSWLGQVSPIRTTGLDGRFQDATQNGRRHLLLDEFEMDAESKSCSEAAELL